MVYLFPGRHVFGLIVSACGLPFRKSAARLPLPLPLPFPTSPCPPAIGSASRQPLNFRTAQNGQNTLANWLFATIAVATVAAAVVAVAATSLLLITTNSNCQRFVRVSCQLQLLLPVPAPICSPSTVLVGALFVANCLWRQRYKENKRRRCRHKQMQLHAPCPMSQSPCRGRVRTAGHL